MNASRDASSTTFPNGFLDFLTPSSEPRNKLDDYEVSPERLEYFNAVLQEISCGAPSLNMDQIITASRRVLARYKDGQRPVFVESRMQSLVRLEEMAANAGWDLSIDDRRRIKRLRRYVQEPEGLLPDALPVIGQLDDALLIDVALQVLRDELADYEDFCRFCQVAADFASVEVAEVGLTRTQWREALEQACARQSERQASRYTPDIRVSLFHIH